MILPGDIDSNLEREESKLLDLDAIRKEMIMSLPAEGDAFKDGAEIVPVPLLPSFRISNKDYVLLTDIQIVFNI